MKITLKDLTKTYNNNKAVDSLSLELEKGEVVGLLGPNGAGKTTTFYMVIGLVKPECGVVLLDDLDITHLPMSLRAQKGISYLPQEPSAFRRLTVEENILLIWEMLNISYEEQKDKLENLLKEFDLWEKRTQPTLSLSGGERRRVEIARALATKPEFVLLDEPFTGIDPIAVADIQNIIAHLKSKGLGVLITDHNVRETLAITDRAYIIHKGKILMSGDSKQIANSPIAKKHYLGEKFTL